MYCNITINVFLVKLTTTPTTTTPTTTTITTFAPRRSPTYSAGENKKIKKSRRKNRVKQKKRNKKYM